MLLEALWSYFPEPISPTCFKSSPAPGMEGLAVPHIAVAKGIQPRPVSAYCAILIYRIAAGLQVAALVSTKRFRRTGKNHVKTTTCGRRSTD